MSERRFTEKPDLDPSAVRGLPDGHPALTENRTLFPSTVVTVTEDAPDRLLVSGENNIKIGKTVEKGEFAGYGIFMLSLEERATCPDDCSVRAFCYGNGMQMARRHRIGDPDVFFDRLGLEIAALLDEHEGLLIRLHVLGDFPSAEYVAFWKEVLDEYPNVACFGYTHRATAKWGGDEIGDAIAAVKSAHPKRFRIRWSSPTDRADGATVIDYIPDGAHSKSGALVCPSQTDSTACCATCALCWERGFAEKTIAFIKHGPKSDEAAARAAMAESTLQNVQIAQNVQIVQPAEVDLKVNGDRLKSEPVADPARRRVRGIQLPQSIRDGYAKTFISPPPEHRLVVPSTLIVEVGYQRDLSGKSLKLIKNIVANWDWARFKPPVCAETPDGLFVIDGQHTAITKRRPESRARQTEINNRRWADPDQHAKMSEANKKRWADPVTRMVFSVEHQRRMSTPEAKARQSARMKANLADPEWHAKHAAAVKRGKNTPEFKAKHRELMKARWADPVMREKYTAANRARNDARRAQK